MDTFQGNYKFIIPISMFYLGFSLVSSSLVHKFVYIFNQPISAGSFIMPFWFLLADIITEVYGYNLSRRFIWSLMIVELFLYGILQFFSHLQYIPGLPNSDAYHIVFGSMLRTYFGVWLVLFLSNYCNTYILAHLKIRFHGKYFWIRSICASSLGEVIYTVAGFYAILGGTVSHTQIFWLITWGCILKITVSALFSLPAAIVAAVLKKYEKIKYINNVNTNSSSFRKEIIS